MSLSNPNKVVTEERLNEYHQTILPYLGGMPDVLANKFSRADLYSTDEKMIGRWIDGKPLYQKTIIDTAQVGWFDIPHNIANVDKVVDTQIGFIHSNAYFKIGCAYSSDSMTASTVGRTNIGIYNSVSAYNGDEVIATIQYTKTTDSPVEIGIDTDYSTDEKIVGTWIDGKPLYQKTIELNFALSDGVELSLSNYISNLNMLFVDMSHSLITNNSGNYMPISFSPGNTVTYGTTYYYVISTRKLRFYTGSGVQNDGVKLCLLTVQYTKTTD